MITKTSCIDRDTINCIYDDCRAELEIIPGRVDEGFWCSCCKEFMTVSQIIDVINRDEPTVKEPPLKNTMDIAFDALVPGRSV